MTPTNIAVINVKYALKLKKLLTFTKLLSTDENSTDASVNRNLENDLSFDFNHFLLYICHKSERLQTSNKD